MKIDEAADDEVLCRMVSMGSASAEEELIKKYSKLVKMCARPFFLTGGDSEDLIQEGMLGLISAIREFKPDGGASFKTFAELCVRRRLYSAIRSDVKQIIIPIDDIESLESRFFDENQAHAAYILRDAFQRGPEEMVIDKERSDEFLASFISHLSEFEAKVLEFYLKGMSYQEVASEINRSAKSVDNAVQRIRRKLARFLNSGDISGS